MSASPNFSAPSAKLTQTSFIQRCLTPEYREIKESRTWKDSPAFRQVLDPLNSQHFTDACLEAEKLLLIYPDFDLIYVWNSSALILQNEFKQAVLVAQEGLLKANRKYNLCVKLGEVSWKTDNLADGVYWWTQAWHCQETLPNLGGSESAFLYLYYVAAELKLNDIAEALIQRVDQIRGGGIRLEVNTASTLRSLARAEATPAIKFVLNQMADKYLGIKAERMKDFEAAIPSAQDIPWAPGQIVEAMGRLEIGLISGLIWEKDKPRPLLEGTWVIPCLKVEAQRYQVKMSLAQKTSSSQACIFEELQPGEYLISYNPFPVEDEAGYSLYWNGKILDFSSAGALFASLSSGSGLTIGIWPGPRGGTIKDETGQILEIKGNTAIGVRGNYPLVVEFLGDHSPYTIQVKPAQTSHLIVRSHVCGS
jgi:hypothetical protein